MARRWEITRQKQKGEQLTALPAENRLNRGESYRAALAFAWLKARVRRDL
jgi:hypothetical protein